MTEAIGCAAALFDATSDPRYAVDYGKFWKHAADYFIDEASGSWIHELATDNSESAIWGTGRPDLYHALQALLLPRLKWGSSVLEVVATSEK